MALPPDPTRPPQDYAPTSPPPVADSARDPVRPTADPAHPLGSTLRPAAVEPPKRSMSLIWAVLAAIAILVVAFLVFSPRTADVDTVPATPPAQTQGTGLGTSNAPATVPDTTMEPEGTTAPPPPPTPAPAAP